MKTLIAVLVVIAAARTPAAFAQSSMDEATVQSAARSARDSAARARLGAPLLRVEETRDSRSISKLKLDDGGRCLRQDNGGSYAPASEEDCRSLRIARAIKARIGYCVDRGSAELNAAYVRQTPYTSAPFFTGSTGAMLHHPHSLFSSGADQDCYCGVFQVEKGRTGAGALNPLEYLFNGDYYNEMAQIVPATKEECMSLFENEGDKAAVSEAYDQTR